MVSRLELSHSLKKRRSRLQDGQLPDRRRYGSYPETVLDEVIEANRRRTWTINAVTGQVKFEQNGLSSNTTSQVVRLISDESDVVIRPSIDGIRN
jgi:hypothetical protein